MLCTKNDGNLLTISKVTIKNIWLTFFVNMVYMYCFNNCRATIFILLHTFIISPDKLLTDKILELKLIQSDFNNSLSSISMF